MPVVQAMRAWVDVDYRATLTDEELTTLPEHPAGDIDAELSEFSRMFDHLATRMETTSSAMTGYAWACCCF